MEIKNVITFTNKESEMCHKFLTWCYDMYVNTEQTYIENQTVIATDVDDVQGLINNFENDCLVEQYMHYAALTNITMGDVTKLERYIPNLVCGDFDGHTRHYYTQVKVCQSTYTFDFFNVNGMLVLNTDIVGEFNGNVFNVSITPNHLGQLVVRDKI